MQHIHHRYFRSLAVAALLALLTACQTVPQGQGPASATRAERLLRQGNHAEAARMYEELAGNNAPPARDEFALAATRAWLDANRADDAQRSLALASPQLPAAQQFERALLQVEVGAARGQYQAAWQQVSQLQEPAEPQNAARLFYLRQQVALRAGLPGDAVRSGMSRERVAADDAARMRARRDLLSDLRGAIDRGLRVEPAASRDALERGWIEIAQIASTAGRSPLSATSMIDNWRRRFPAHPAATIVESEILDPAARPDAGRGLAQVAGPVALLLPLSDSDPGRASLVALIRDGFQAQVARLPDAGISEVRIYDTAAMPVGAALQRAVAEGATFIVGPLTREEVQVAAEQRPVHVPVLLLNTLPDGGGAGTWQFALSPEDEARQIARQIAGAGGRSAAVLTPADAWGQRVAAAFSEALRAAGGNVVAEGTYDLARNNIEAAITSTLGIDAGRQRHRRVQEITGARLQYTPRPSPDVDAVFVAGYQPLAVRQFRPFLHFYNAGELPTYITSDGLGAERAANRDLEGMRLVDMPWVLDTVGIGYDARLATEGLWQGRGDARDSRYFAFGYDAARIAAALQRGQARWPMEGVTGRLSLSPEGRVERQLNWARVREGAIVPADPGSP
jgi:outer membrane PBP1 activator LpoA protein